MALRRRPVLRRFPTLTLRRVLLGASAAFVVALSAAAPAGAVTATLGSSSFGFEPREAAAPVPNWTLAYHGGPVMHSNNTYAIYWAPPAPGDASGQYDSDYKSLINRFLSDVSVDSGSLTNVYALTGQYTDTTGHAQYKSSFRGAFTDTQPYPTTGTCLVGSLCITDAQVRSELSRFIGANSLTPGTSTIFLMLTPPGVTVCTDSAGTDCSAPTAPTSFCSYHSFIGDPNAPGPSSVIYAVQPWTVGTAGTDMSWGLQDQLGVLGTSCQDSTPYSTTLGLVPVQEEPNQIGLDTDGDYDVGLADLIVNEISVEQIDTITNPFLNGWYENGTHAEEADQCRDDFLTAATPKKPPAPDPDTGADRRFNQVINNDHWYLNDEFNLAATKVDYPDPTCLPFINLAALFTAPNAVNAGDIVGFDATESIVSLGPGTYSWSFGDGSPAATSTSVFHTYAAPGSYTVSLSVTDAGGNVSGATRQVLVGGTVPSAPGTGTGSITGSTAGKGATTGGSGGSTTPGSKPGAGSAKAPAATERIVTHSLAKARRGGVTVRYHVDQAVAGRFQIVIDAATAKRLHIKGAHVSSGASSRGSVVIGTAILVTLQGGGSKLSIHFTKNAASHLTHARTLKITVKMTVASDNSQRAIIDAATVLR